MAAGQRSCLAQTEHRHWLGLLGQPARGPGQEGEDGIDTSLGAQLPNVPFRGAAQQPTQDPGPSEGAALFPFKACVNSRGMGLATLEEKGVRRR